MWKILFHRTASGKDEVNDFIDTLQPQTHSKIVHLIDLLQEYGPAVKMPYVKRISLHLSELRVRGKQEVRVFFTIRGFTIYMLHGFIKKSQKTPQKELKKAFNRLDNL